MQVASTPPAPPPAIRPATPPANPPTAPTTARDAGRLALELFVAGYEGTELPESYATRLRQGLSGVILFSRNLQKTTNGQLDLVHLTAQTAQVQAEAGHASALPALCAVDQEGGLVARLRSPMSHFAAMADVAEQGGCEATEAIGEQTGRECLAAGFNVDFAPILDINTNPDNPIIGRRAFGRTADDVIRFGGAFLRGLQRAGVLGCGKHFPGHGDTDTDSHLALPVLDFDLERLKRVELKPFAALAAELPMVMTAHILFRALDPNLPATLSPEILVPLLRDYCGFSGVIVSDDLEMKGVAGLFSFRESVRLGLQAGNDLFLVCRREDALMEALDEAARILLDGGPPQARALAAIGRVRRLRATATRPRPSVAAVRTALDHPGATELRSRYAAGCRR